ncbi:MAG: FlgD immunoglobulin-like domain containing protein [Candidatus Eisenbacteria bacterium]
MRPGDRPSSRGTPSARHVHIDILNAEGRVVRTFDALFGADAAVTWRGEDSRGRPTAAGVYFVRARGGAADSVRRLVRIR